MFVHIAFILIGFLFLGWHNGILYEDPKEEITFDRAEKKDGVLFDRLDGYWKYQYETRNGSIIRLV